MIKTIGIDLDQTLIKHKIEPEKQAAKNLGILNYPEINDWYFTNLTKLHVKEILRLFDDPYFMGINCNYPYEGSQEKIFKWSSLGYKIIIITARNEPVRKATEFMVERFFPTVDKLLFVGIEDSKRDLMIENKLDIWIDDNPKGVQTSCELKIETYLIYNEITKKYIPKETINNLPINCVKSIIDIKLKGE